MNMRKIPHLSMVSSVIVLAFIVPQIAFAAWWNPLSWFNGWSFFHRTDTQTQILENRVKELERRLGDTATSTPATATTKPTSSFAPLQGTTQTKQAPAKQSVAGKNYNYILISMADSWVKFNNNSIKDTNSAIPDVQDAINFRNQQKETYRVLVAGVLQNEQLANLFIGEFDKDIAYYEKVKTYLNNLIAIWNNHIPLAEQFQKQATQKFYATELATSQDAKTLFDEYSKDVSLYSLMSNTYSEVIAYERKRGQEYIDAMNMLRSAANASAQTNVVNNFVYSSPAPAAVMTIPTINYPTQQRCTVSPIGGGGVDLVVSCY